MGAGDNDDAVESDLFAEANRVLARARQVRGVPDEAPVKLEAESPLERARAVLDDASAARASSIRPDPPEKRLQRALQEATLRRLKRERDPEAT